MKLPALMFYTTDWLEEPGLKLSSLAARGLWIDMLCIMSAAQPRGYLKVNDKPLTEAQLAMLVRADVSEVTRLLKELDAQSVFSRNAQGVIYSRRIVRDEKIRQQNSRNGKRGGNPILRGDNFDSLNRPLKPPLIPPIIRPPEDEDGIEDAIRISEGGLGETSPPRPTNGKSRGHRWVPKPLLPPEKSK